MHPKAKIAVTTPIAFSPHCHPGPVPGYSTEDREAALKLDTRTSLGDVLAFQKWRGCQPNTEKNKIRTFVQLF
jgi:peroxiredoxin